MAQFDNKSQREDQAHETQEQQPDLGAAQLARPPGYHEYAEALHAVGRLHELMEPLSIAQKKELLWHLTWVGTAIERSLGNTMPPAMHEQESYWRTQEDGGTGVPNIIGVLKISKAPLDDVRRWFDEVRDELSLDRPREVGEVGEGRQLRRELYGR